MEMEAPFDGLLTVKVVKRKKKMSFLHLNPNNCKKFGVHVFLIVLIVCVIKW